MTLGRCQQLLEDTFIRMQGQFGATWAEACHICIGYGLDALWMNHSHEEALAELQLAREQIDNAMQEHREELS